MDVLLQFLRYVLQTIALPFYLELQFAPEQVAVWYLFYFVLLLVVDQDWWGWQSGMVA